MKNEAIIMNQRIDLMNAGVLSTTGRKIHFKMDSGVEVDVMEPEEIHTFKGWESKGFRVRKGERAVASFPVWSPTDGGIVRLVTRSFFTEGQVKPISDTGLRIVRRPLGEMSANNAEKAAKPVEKPKKKAERKVEKVEGTEYTKSQLTAARQFLRMTTNYDKNYYAGTIGEGKFALSNYIGIVVLEGGPMGDGCIPHEESKGKWRNNGELGESLHGIMESLEKTLGREEVEEGELQLEDVKRFIRESKDAGRKRMAMPHLSAFFNPELLKRTMEILRWSWCRTRMEKGKETKPMELYGGFGKGAMEGRAIIMPVRVNHEKAEKE